MAVRIFFLIFKKIILYDALAVLKMLLFVGCTSFEIVVEMKRSLKRCVYVYVRIAWMDFPQNGSIQHLYYTTKIRSCRPNFFPLLFTIKNGGIFTETEEKKHKKPRISEFFRISGIYKNLIIYILFTIGFPPEYRSRHWFSRRFRRVRAG